MYLECAQREKLLHEMPGISTLSPVYGVSSLTAFWLDKKNGLTASFEVSNSPNGTGFGKKALTLLEPQNPSLFQFQVNVSPKRFPVVKASRRI